MKLLPALLLSSWCALAAASPAASPAGPPTGFFVAHRLDGQPFHKPLYQLGGSYDHAYLQEGDYGMPGLSFRLRVASTLAQGQGHAIDLWVHHGLDLASTQPQRFALRGQGPCGTGEPESPQAEAFVVRGGQASGPQYQGRTYKERDRLDEANDDVDAAHTGAKQHRTLAPGTYGRFDGELVVTHIDTDMQTIAGRYQYRAVRLITVGRDRWGAYLGDCGDASTFRADALRITVGEFKVRYCTDPANPRNPRTCQN